MKNKGLKGGVPDNFWAIEIAQVLKTLLTSEKGLSSASAARRLREFGPNTIKATGESSVIALYLQQFKSPITLLLIGAAVLSAALADVVNALIILIIVFVSSILSFWQDRRASNAIKELLKMVQIRTTVLRDGEETEIAVEKVVPGDIVLLSAGDVVPADCLLMTSGNLFVDEAAFTGETFPAEKDRCLTDKNAAISKRKNVVFMGTHVISGKAMVLVVKTGKQTELGKISQDLTLKTPETEFEKGIRKLGYLLMEITLMLVIVIFGINVFLQKPVLDSFLFSLALAVGLTPQLLPAIISVNLATGAKSMAAKQVIVKRLSSIENFGGMNILCSDKTGTITKGSVQLHDAVLCDNNSSEKVLEYAWLNASLQEGFHNAIDDAICLSCQSKFPARFQVCGEVPYDFIRKRLTVAVTDGQQQLVISKGAVKNILEVCDSVELANGTVETISAFQATIDDLYHSLSCQGYRTLGVAYKHADTKSATMKEQERNMIFLGFITLYDPPKDDITTTIQRLGELGVELKVITGDNPLIAENLALKIGFLNPKILTGAQLLQMSESALLHQAIHTNVFAEVEPNQKERIINALRKAGNVVGFMGDGINDAPALHAADVGISVDSAVDVAKQAADLVLLNHDLGVLIDGIIAGRKAFTNTMKYIFMATSANFGNMFSMAGASLFLTFLPLLPKQILLTNVLTDFPEMAIATDRVEDVNIRSPQRWDMKFIRRFMIVFGLLSSAFDYLTFALLLKVLHVKEQTFQTGWFTESVISAALIVLVIRTRSPFMKSLPGKYLSLATLSIVLFVSLLPYTPLAQWFGFFRLPAFFFLYVLPVIVAYVACAELTKHWFYRKMSGKCL